MINLYNIDIKDIAAFWGAFLSTTLGLIKLYEKWSQKIEISIGFDSRQEVGNTVAIRNLYDRPIIVTNWELQFCEKRYFKWTPYRREDPEDETNDFFIDSYSSEVITFSGSRYFSTSYKELEGKGLVFKLHIAGRRWPIRRLLYRG